MLLRHTLAIAAAGDVRMAVDDNVLLVCDVAAGSASAFDVGEESAPGDMLQPLATVQLVPEQVRPNPLDARGSRRLTIQKCRIRLTLGVPLVGRLNCPLGGFSDVRGGRLSFQLDC